MSVWTHVNGSQTTANASTGATVAVTLGWSATVGNLLIATAAVQNSTQAMSIADSGGNSWALAKDAGIAARRTVSWTAVVATGGVLTITATCAVSTQLLSLIVDEFACSGTIGAVEGAVTANGTSAGPSPGAIVPTGNDLLYTAFGSTNQGGGAATISSPFVVCPNGAYASGVIDLAGAYALDVIASQTPVWSIASSQAWTSVGFAVKGPAAGVKVPYHLLFRGANLSLMDTP